MRILLTNDDGFGTPGLLALVDALHALGEVTVCVPEHPNSGVGHAITFTRPLRLKKIRGPVPVPAYTLDGTPADCVKFAFLNLLSGPPDLVVSGINAGANAGRSSFNSGTVAAAVEGLLRGCTSLALSMENTPRADYAYAAGIGRALAQTMADGDLFYRRALSVNFPGRPREEIRGYKITRASLKGIREWFEERRDEEGTSCYQIVDRGFDREEDPDTDLGALQAGFIALTPLAVGLSDDDYLRRLKAFEPSLPPAGREVQSGPR